VVERDRDKQVQRGRIQAAQNSLCEIGPHAHRIAKRRPLESPA
jgi:hypothetical protein